MTNTDAARLAEADRYREMAKEIRALLSALKHSEAANDLRLLADRYERLAEYHTVASSVP